MQNTKGTTIPREFLDDVYPSVEGKYLRNYSKVNVAVWSTLSKCVGAAWNRFEAVLTVL